jgi:hypothetical protein
VVATGAGGDVAMSMYDLKELRQAATDACLLAAARAVGSDMEVFRGEPIKFAKLSCFSAEYVIDDAGVARHEVWINNAAPECFRLQAFIKRELKKRGFLHVDVYTEW